MKNTRSMTEISLFIVMYIISSKFSISLGIIPFTLQTCVVFFAGCILTPKQIFISYSIYFLMGFCGLPVFATGGGFVYILKPSCGFLFSFPFAAAFISWCRSKWNINSLVQLFPICLLGLGFIYMVGSGYMYFIMNIYLDHAIDVSGVIAAGVLPFMISDSVSCFIACLCAVRIYPALRSFPIKRNLKTH